MPSCKCKVVEDLQCGDEDGMKKPSRFGAKALSESSGK